MRACSSPQLWRRTMQGSAKDPQQLRRVRFADFADPTTARHLDRMGVEPQPSGRQASRDLDVVIFAGCLMERRDAVLFALDWLDPHALSDALSYPHHWPVAPDPYPLILTRLAPLFDPQLPWLDPCDREPEVEQDED